MNNLSPALVKWMNSQTTELRKHPVGINWYSLDNSQLVATGISPNKFENWLAIFSDDNETLKEPWYLNDLFTLLFTDIDAGYFANQNSDNRKALKKLKENVQSKLIPDADTIICLPNEKRIHRAVERILNNIVSSTHSVYVMNGDETTNATCEERMVEYSKRARHNNKKCNKKCIFLTSLMGIRSWSNKYVKNVILLFDGGSFDTNTQRIARAWTPWYDKDADTWHDMCSIFDFRLSYDTPSLMERHICGILENKENFSKDDIDEFAEKIEASDKISFFDYKDTNSQDPFRKLSKEDIVTMLGSNISFSRVRLLNLIINNIKNIRIPLSGDFDINAISAVENTNTKGDSAKTLTRNLSKEMNKVQKNSDGEDELDEIKLKLKYIHLVLNYGYLFNFERVKENVLQTICDRIDTYKNKAIFKQLWFDTIKDILLQVNEMNDKFDDIFIWQ